MAFWTQSTNENLPEVEAITQSQFQDKSSFTNNDDIQIMDDLTLMVNNDENNQPTRTMLVVTKNTFLNIKITE